MTFPTLVRVAGQVLELTDFLLWHFYAGGFAIFTHDLIPFFTFYHPPTQGETFLEHSEPLVTLTHCHDNLSRALVLWFWATRCARDLLQVVLLC